MPDPASAQGEPRVGDVGAGSARVVFLHGLFGQGRNFTQIAKALAPDFTSLLI